MSVGHDVTLLARVARSPEEGLKTRQGGIEIGPKGVGGRPVAQWARLSWGAKMYGYSVPT